MKVAIFGGSGFIGKRLTEFLAGQGWEVWVVSRSSRKSNHPHIQWATWQEVQSFPALFEGFDAFVNLAGESINQRWTRAAKDRVLESRLWATGQIAKLTDKLDRRPEVVINGSGVSLYGLSETAVFDESSPFVNDHFLAEVVWKWEQAADRIEGVRLIKLRTGIVLDRTAEAYQKMSLPYKLGIGGRVGSGRQWLPWIHLEDMVRLIQFCIEREDMKGPVNAAAPNPVTNAQFGEQLARAIKRPNWFPVPSLVMKLVFGELSILLLEGQRVMPRNLLDHGFVFRYPDIEEAIRELTRRERP
ncbi:TIGR01777 family oxidoreductase [Paenibacillus sp. y28]|uniref:TIGR01777 family oxidoreductase n=1 Tax=Paenibacillus sp. y28 TaxID=3129110 RepID=UPI00301A3179